MGALGGFVGFSATLIAGRVIHGGNFGYLRGLITLGVLVAGAGWLVGTAVGLVLTGAASPRTSVEAWALRSMAALFVVAGLSTPWWTLALKGTQGLGYHITARVPLLRSIWADAALAAITCLMLAQTRFRRQAFVIGGIGRSGSRARSSSSRGDRARCRTAMLSSRSDHRPPPHRRSRPTVEKCRRRRELEGCDGA